MTTFELELGHADGMGVLTVEGEVDLDTAAAFETKLTTALGGGTAVIVDLTKCEFIDSTGLAVLVRASRKLNGRGPLRLVLSDANVRRVFEISHLEGQFALYPRLLEALES